MRTIILYTDGACKRNPGPGGWAAVLSHKASIEIISGNTAIATNNMMELTAVLKGIKRAMSLYYNKVIVNTDSAYVVNTINKGWLTKWSENNWKTKKGEPVKNSVLWKELYQILESESYEVVINKVKGHAGSTFNELADNEASRQAEIANVHITNKSGG